MYRNRCLVQLNAEDQKACRKWLIGWCCAYIVALGALLGVSSLLPLPSGTEVAQVRRDNWPSKSRPEIVARESRAAR
jgi:hypothetical protein